MLRLEPYGNLVIYTKDSEVIQDSMTNHHGVELMWLACQNGNDVVSYGNDRYHWANVTAHVIPFRVVDYQISNCSLSEFKFSISLTCNSGSEGHGTDREGQPWDQLFGQLGCNFACQSVWFLSLGQHKYAQDNRLPRRQRSERQPTSQ